ncbi:MAG: hypothetical protein DRH08_04560 [Deltaproteobacteria bacterium]|nr:MAG: hypothetical protein DRH08_04560 [Deltaproteobacteria bacterium]
MVEGIKVLCMYKPPEHLVGGLFVSHTQVRKSAISRVHFDKPIAMKKKCEARDMSKSIKHKQARWYVWRDGHGGHEMEVGERIWK